MAWHTSETNAFIHFSVNTFTDKEWGYGDEDPRLFNPASLDADQWVKTLKDAGFKTVILTVKHHDGFCLWPSKFTEHSVKHSPYKEGRGDVVKEVSDAVRKYGLRFGIYLSPWDRNRADYGTPSYIEYYRNQLRELFTTYGPISEMWFDGANGGDGYYGGAREKRTIDKTTYYDWPATLELVRSFAPEIIFFSDAGPGVRWVGNESGVAGTTNWNMISTDTLYAGKAGIETLLSAGSENGNAWVPAEVDVSIRPGWFYHEAENARVKKPQELLKIYLTSVGRGSTLLLNVPPDRTGRLHDDDVRSLADWKKLLDREFENDLAFRKIAVASSWRGNDDRYSASNVVDHDPRTYWTTDDEKLSGSIEITFDGNQSFRYVVLEEGIQLGQRIKSFTVEAFDGHAWKMLVPDGVTIGHKRIFSFPTTVAGKVRVTIKDARACPVLTGISVF